MTFIIQPKINNISWYNTGEDFIIKAGELKIIFDIFSFWDNDIPPVIDFDFINYEIREETVKTGDRYIQISDNINEENRIYNILFDDLGKITFKVSKNDNYRIVKYYFENVEQYYIYI